MEGLAPPVVRSLAVLMLETWQNRACTHGQKQRTRVDRRNTISTKINTLEFGPKPFYRVSKMFVHLPNNKTQKGKRQRVVKHQPSRHIYIKNRVLRFSPNPSSYPSITPERPNPSTIKWGVDIEKLWHCSDNLEILRHKIKIFMKCKGFEILPSKTSLDLGFDLDFVVWKNFGTQLILVWNAPLIVLYSSVISGRLVSHRAVSPLLWIWVCLPVLSWFLATITSIPWGPTLYLQTADSNLQVLV